MLMVGGMGFTGMTPDIYFSLTDFQVATLLLAERDEDGAVIPECNLAGGRERKRLRSAGTVERAGEELPSAEALKLPPEVMADMQTHGFPMDWTLCWWQVWRARDTETTEELLERWHRENIVERRSG